MVCFSLLPFSPVKLLNRLFPLRFDNPRVYLRGFYRRMPQLLLDKPVIEIACGQKKGRISMPQAVNMKMSG